MKNDKEAICFDAYKSVESCMNKNKGRITVNQPFQLHSIFVFSMLDSF